jgi:tetratricopeptide (TPR) repeat protein
VRRGLLLLLALTAGVALRVRYFLDSRADPTFHAPIIDAATYHRLAAELAAGHLPTEPFFQPPLYPLVLGGGYALAGADPVLARAMGIVLGLGTMLLAANLGRRLVSPGAGVWAAAIVALSAPSIYFEQQLLPAGLAAFLTTLAAVALARAMERRTRSAAALAGLAVGLAGINVPNMLALGALGVGLAGISALRRRGRRAVVALAFAAGVAAPVVPVALWNTVTAGRPAGVATNGGINLYLGNNPDAVATEAMRPGYEWTELFREATRAGATDRASADRYYLTRATGWIRTHPEEFAGNVLRRARLLLSGRELARNQDLYTHAEVSPTLALLAAPAGRRALPFAPVIALAIVGLVGVGSRRDRRAVAVLVGVYAATMLLFPVSSRYRVPLVPVLAVFAVLGAHRLLRPGEVSVPRRWFDRGLAAAGFACALLPVVAPADATSFRSEIHAMLGQQALGRGEVAEAERELERAVAVDEDNGLGWQLLGVARQQAGDAEGAERALRRAVVTPHVGAESHVLLADLLRSTGRNEEAEAEYRRAVEVSPRAPRAHAALAAYAAGRGDAESAVGLLRLAAEADPLDPGPGLELAWILATSRDATLRNGREAVRRVEEALARLKGETPLLVLDPGALETHAAALAEVGDFVRAMRVGHRAVTGWEARESAPDAERAAAAARGYEREEPLRSDELHRPGGMQMPR